MSERAATPTVGARSFAKKALVAAVTVASLSIFLPTVVWRVGRWDIIFAVSASLFLSSGAILLCGALSLRRGARGMAFATMAISTLALLFWGVLIFAFIHLSGGGE
jgi:hypothetical protein